MQRGCVKISEKDAKTIVQGTEQRLLS